MDVSVRALLLVNVAIFILGSSCERHVAQYASGRFSEIVFTINFQRLNDFYMRNLLLPNALLLGITALIFFLPVDCGERIGFGVTLTLSLCVNLMIVTEYIPETSKTIPNICNYFLTSIILSGVAIIMATISINVHIWHVSKLRKSARMRIREESVWKRTEPNLDVANVGSRSDDNFNNLHVDNNSNYKMSNGSYQSCSSNIELLMNKIDDMTSRNAEIWGDTSPNIKRLDCAIGTVYFVATNLYSFLFIYSLSSDKF